MLDRSARSAPAETRAERVRPRRVLLGANTRHAVVDEAVGPLTDALVARGIEVRTWDDDGEDPAQALDGIDLIVVLGGDGFMMSLIRSLEYPATPFFGVNFGRVGFLMNPMADGARLAEILTAGSFVATAYPVLEGRVLGNDGPLVLRAFNDFVLERASGQTVHLRTSIDDVLLNEYSGDGLIVATPGGSTAYSLAAGGPVVHHAVPGILVTPLNPHRPVQFHSLQFPLVVPLTSRVHIVAEERHKRPVRFTADGKQVEDVEEIEIRDSSLRVLLLRVPEYQFIDTLVRKIIGRRVPAAEDLQE